MGLHSPCSLATTLTVLDAAGIAIVQRDEGWFIELPQQATGPYTTPELAVEASVHWLTKSHWQQTSTAYAALRADPQASDAT